MTLPMGRITRNYLITHRLCPHQCAPNMFRILGCVDALNAHLQLGLTWHDVVHMYEFHSQADGEFYLKSRSVVIRLISCLPKSNKGIKDDYLIASGPWHNGLPCPTQERETSGIPQSQVPQQKILDLLIFIAQLLSFILHYFNNHFSRVNHCSFLGFLLQIKDQLLLGSAIPMQQP